MKKYLAECIGTFALVFCGTGAIIVNEASGGVVGHIGIAVTFGLIVLAMIYALGDISGAHLNPAVTLAFWSAGRFQWREVLPFSCSQITGAILASFILTLLFPQSQTLGATLPSGSSLQAFILEIILAFFLMFVIINVSTGAKEKGITAGAAIGSIIALEAMLAGPITGASMNPARSLAPALFSGNFSALWVYLVAPFIGAFLGILGCRGVKGSECCGKPDIFCASLEIPVRKSHFLNFAAVKPDLNRKMLELEKQEREGYEVALFDNGENILYRDSEKLLEIKITYTTKGLNLHTHALKEWKSPKGEKLSRDEYDLIVKRISGYFSSDGWKVMLDDGPNETKAAP